MSREWKDQLTKDLSDDERFVLRVAAMLDASLPALPPQVSRKLDSARHAAMMQAWGGPESMAHTPSGIAKALDDSAESLPPQVKARLDAMRHAAMAQARGARHQQTRWQQLKGWVASMATLPRVAVPAGAFASVSVLVIALTVFDQGDMPEVMPLALAEDALLLASEEEMELYQNLEFYQWLADNGLQY